MVFDVEADEVGEGTLLTGILGRAEFPFRSFGSGGFGAVGAGRVGTPFGGHGGFESRGGAGELGGEGVWKLLRGLEIHFEVVVNGFWVGGGEHGRRLRVCCYGRSDGAGSRSASAPEMYSNQVCLNSENQSLSFRKQ